MARSGCLVAVCGIDGSGKTVQTERLAQRARAAGWAVQTTSFPRYQERPFGPLIGRYLRGELGRTADGVDPYLAALPFACDRWQMAPALREWLGKGALLICNRYVSANCAHQGAKIADAAGRREFVRWVEDLEYNVFALPRPDLQVLLQMPPPRAQSLISGKEQRSYLREASDIHESDLAYLEATARAYDELAEGGARWLRVDCAPGGRLLEPEQIAEQVWGAVEGLMKARGPGGTDATKGG
jgi:dTMP kinase